MFKHRDKTLQSCSVAGKTICFHSLAEQCDFTSHGLHQAGLDGVYHNMMKRCFNPRHRKFKNYGGRGLSVEPWLQNPMNFKTHIQHVLGPRPPGFVLDRIDNEKGYERNNLRWTTPAISRCNQRPCLRTRFVTYNGKTQGIRAWSRELGIARTTLSERLMRGWSVEKAMTVPPQQNHAPPISDNGGASVV